MEIPEHLLRKARNARAIAATLAKDPTYLYYATIVWSDCEDLVGLFTDLDVAQAAFPHEPTLNGCNWAEVSDRYRTWVVREQDPHTVHYPCHIIHVLELDKNYHAQMLANQ